MDGEKDCEVFEPNFTKICSGIQGAEGPVFDKDGRFYMVAPEVTKNEAYAGQVLRINLENGKPELMRDGSIWGPIGPKWDPPLTNFFFRCAAQKEKLNIMLKFGHQLPLRELQIKFAFQLDWVTMTYFTAKKESDLNSSVRKATAKYHPGLSVNVFATVTIMIEVEKHNAPFMNMTKTYIWRVGPFIFPTLSPSVDNLVDPLIDGNGGIPAGCQCDRDGNIWIADMRLGLIKVSPNGDCKQVCQKDENDAIMQGCNDCAFDYTANLWVTAPAGSIAPHPYTRSMEEPFGSVYCYTNEKKMVKIDTDIRFPNGIAVLHTPDGTPKTLIVAETPTKTLWGYQILGPGKVGPRSVWGKLPGTLEGGPDGMDFDEEDNLLVAHWGSSHIEVFGGNGGAPHTRIKCPFDRPSNLHFQKGTKVVYVTEHDSHGLWKFEWKRSGKLQYCDTLDL